MPSDYTPRPGDIFLVRFGGIFGGVISFLQAVVAGAPSRYGHCGVFLPDGKVIQAGAKGTAIANAADVMAKRPLAIMPLPDWADRDRVVKAALTLEGRPYNYISYLWIGLTKLVPWVRPPRWMRKQVSGDARLICSAMCDRAWTLGGVHLFNDGRLLGAVTPGDLAYAGWVFHVDTGPFERATKDSNE